MSSHTAAEVECLGGDPAHYLWRWLLFNGPHGPDFSWKQTRREPPGYVGIDHLQRIVDEMAEADPTFLTRAREVVGLALSSADTKFLYRAVQVGAVVGTKYELHLIKALESHENEPVASNARAAAFHMKARHRGARPGA